MSEPRWQPRSDRSARLLGGAFFCGGLGLVWMQARSILDAVADTRPVTTFSAAIGLGLFCLVVGGTWLVRGLAGYTATRRLQQQPRALRIVAVVTVLVVGGILLALRSWLTAQGYAS